MMRMTLLAFSMLWGVGHAAAAQTEWEVVKTFQIGGQGSWDYLTVDPQAHLLYVPRT
ncbi:MAG: hypothetical protein JWP63_3985, partial [Candidatus Solibacter sp.]|nr:hypothetical protein [Candidatus Solibacter sp.]